MHDGIETPLIRGSKIDPQICFLFIQKKKTNFSLNFSIRSIICRDLTFRSVFLLFFFSLFLHIVILTLVYLSFFFKRQRRVERMRGLIDPNRESNGNP